MKWKPLPSGWRRTRIRRQWFYLLTYSFNGFTTYRMTTPALVHAANIDLLAWLTNEARLDVESKLLKGHP